ncbi:transcription factor DIVARICATA [Elaeis guineensis]|uniref:transcription factor DIVARICATA n=1 Tax=Elaeis guineensis var. tenera TaxID=51953 RepID=UPI003C6D108E
MSSNETPSLQTQWSWYENKTFEVALTEYPEGTPNRWPLITAKLSGKSLCQVLDHYRALIHDLELIDSGKVETPNYRYDDNSDRSNMAPKQHPTTARSGRGEERRKSVPWTEKEHRLFLKGLAAYGKGDWKNISRNSVVTKTSSQVASHAQKFFNRREQNKESKRKSIHDITDP